MGVRQELDECEDVFREHGAVAVYLFGSHAREQADSRSDIDVGVLFNDYEGIKQVARLEADLDPLFEKDIDVRPLNVDDLIFKKEVVSEGELVVEYDREKRIDFEESVMRRYLDMKPFIERYNNKRSERLEALTT